MKFKVACSKVFLVVLHRGYYPLTSHFATVSVKCFYGAESCNQAAFPADKYNSVLITHSIFFLMLKFRVGEGDQNS